jgi:hypothetical protein
LPVRLLGSCGRWASLRSCNHKTNCVDKRLMGFKAR